MIETLKSQIDRYLPKMEPGSTFLDAGCHRGEMYDILINGMKLDIHYCGIEENEDLYNQATERYGPHFININFMDWHLKYDYVWCTQMTHDDNGSSFRHLAGLAKKQLVYSHILPCQGHEDVRDSVQIFTDNRFRIYVA